MINRTDINLLQFNHESFYDENFEISSEKNGLALAFAFFNYNLQEKDMDPSYGELIFNVTEWTTVNEKFIIERK